MPKSDLLRTLFRAVAKAGAGIVLAVGLSVAQAATTTITLGFDTDNNAGTGCTLVVGSQTLPGIEVALDTIATTTTSTGTVGAVTRRTCTGGSFGAPTAVSVGGWAIGMTTGTGGSDLIETFIPLSGLPGATLVKIGAITASDSVIGTQLLDLSAAPPQGPLAAPIPTLSPVALIMLLLLVAGTGWLLRRYAREGGTTLLLLLCAVAISLTTLSAWAIVRDGNGADWAGIAPLGTDPSGDAAAGDDLVALFAVKDGVNVSLRVDAVLARDASANQPPVVNAGANQTITLPAGATLNGSATDDGLPNPPGQLTYLWTKVSGTGNANFGNATQAATTATFTAADTYVLRLTASDGALSGSATVTITVNPGGGGANQPPTVNAGTNQTITLPTAATLAGTATDDGLPNPPSALNTTWSLVSGPASGVVFGNAALPGTTATFAAPGVYVLRLTADDGALASSSDVQVTVIDGAPLFLSVPDRTISLGTRYQQLLVASDGNVNDVLAYTLVAAPAGASLNPAPLVDWVPTAAQLGTHSFTAKVTDSSGHSATTTFNVTVVHVNQPPQLLAQPNLTIAVGTAFARTLTASDPDAGDVLTFALVAGPGGMTLSGSTLNWSTSGRNPGDYVVTVKVTDAAGLSDQKSFTITLQQSAPGPIAKDDSYTVKVAHTLTVPASGVLANDLYAGTNALTAAKLSDPNVGALTAFNSDGSFTYLAPATPPGTPLSMAKEWSAGVGSDRYRELVADLNGDGYPDIISFDNNAGIRARSGLNGSQLWSADTTGAPDCAVNTGQGSMDSRVLADIDDSGHPALAFTTICTREGSPWYDNIVAFDYLGHVKWVSPPLSKPHPDIVRGATPPPPGGFTPGGVATGSGLSVARLTAGGPPVLLMRQEIPRDWGYSYYYDAAGVFHYAGCRAVTGLVADENVACRVTFIISGVDGSVLQTLVVRNPTATDTYYGSGPNSFKNLPPIAIDIDGDGRVDLVSGTEVWMQNAAGGFDFAWQLSTSVNDTAVADLDGDGKAEIIHLRATGFPADMRGIFIYSFDGQLKRRIPFQGFWITALTIADVDGDGRSDIVLGADGTVYAFRDDGRPIWAYVVPLDTPDNPVFAPFYVQQTQQFQLTNAAPQVYDLDGDGVAEVVFSAYSRIIVLDGRTGVRKLNPYWTYNWSYHDISALMLLDMNNDGHVDVVQNSAFIFNCNFVGADFLTQCINLIGPTALSGGGTNNWMPGPKAFPHVQYRSTAIDNNSRVLHDTTVSRIFRTPVQQGTIGDPRLAQATSFTYEASDGTATSAPATVIIDIVPDNRPPVFTSVPPTSLLQSATQNFYDVTATDPDAGDTITFSLKQAPGWVTMSGPARVGFQAAYSWGQTMVIVTATDSRGASTDQIFIVNLTTTSVTVPNVVGMLLAAAETALLAGDLQGVQWAEQFDLAPAGTVLAQEAAAGAVVGQFDTIKLTVSTGPQPVLMPFVIGMQLAPANSILVAAGLSVNVSTTFSNTIPAGEITAQSPAANTLLLPATAPPVDLTVSAGGALPAPIASIVLKPGPGPLSRLANTDMQFKAVAILTDGTSADVTLTAAWSTTNAAAATVDVTGFVKAKASGSATIAATLSGKTGQVSVNVSSLVPGDNTPPTAAITSPMDDAAVTGPTPIVGSTSDANFLRYELAFAPAGAEDFTVIAEGTTAVTNGALGTFDPTALLNDVYTLRLRVFDKGENESVVTRTVQVTGKQKPGLFALAYQDLIMPTSGIPVTVTRNYDSRDKAKGDFGVGWRLGLQTLRLHTNRAPGTGWVRTVSGPTVSLVPTSVHKVSLTLPGGKVEEFDLQLSPTSGIGGLDFTNVTGYVARPGTLGKLEMLDNPNLLILSGVPEDELVDDSTLDTFDPVHYRYTSESGIKVEINRTLGVTKTTDRNGNTVTLGVDGIIHSAGPSIVFIRDSKGRISQITDPMGNVQSYVYDGNGDLVSHITATGAVARFAYDYNHNLIDIVDPAGYHATRNQFDAGGHLISTTDPRGNTITFSNNSAAQREVVTDRLGYPVTYDYDGMGNVTAKTDAFGKVTTYTFDGRNNQLTETDPLGRVASKTYDSNNNLLTSIDFDGNTTTSTYNTFGQVLTQIDPEGHLTTNVFSAVGDVTQTTDPEGGVTTYAYDGAGNRTSMTDALGRVTTYAYNASGYQTSKTNPLGKTTTYTFDANGHALSETDAAGKTTFFTYDAAGRKTSETDKLGNTDLASYTDVGLGIKISKLTDAMGRVTTIDYDPVVNPLKRTYPDGSSETSTYDFENERVSSNDPDGRTTLFDHDALRRTTKTTLPGGVTVLVSYDAVGRVLTRTDERGNITSFTYGPNRQTVTDPLSHATVQVYDSQRRLVNATDALGHVSSFTYDSLGNPLRTTYPDGTFNTVTYDAARQKTAETDQAGRTKQFAYDAAGRLIRVTDALGGITSYAYDAVGNLVTVTDANGRATVSSYDAMGRIVSRTLPSGKQESFVFDAVGNTVSHTDFKGVTTNFSYDAKNRLTSKYLPGGNTIVYTYSAAGLRTQAGGDSYVYDAAGRLSQEHKTAGDTLAYGYDPAGNRTSLTAPQGTTTYTYDALNQFSTVVDPTGTTTYAYDLVGRIASMIHPNGVTTTYSYDALDRLVLLANTGSGGLVSSYAYTLGPNGNRVQVAEAGSATTGRTVTYTYDALYRLTQEQITEPGPAISTVSYALDAVGNRMQLIRGGVTTAYTYDSSDRLITEVSGGSTVTSTYDDNGNLVGRSSGAGTDAYVYDAENRMTSSSGPGGTFNYGYDADGMRLGRIAGGVTTAFLLDKNRDVPQVLAEVTGANTVTYSYGHQLLSQQRSGVGSYLYLADGQRSMRQLSNAAGNVTDSYTYDAFGVPLASTGTTPNDFRYSGEQVEPSLGLYYLRARYFEPAKGRFTTPDPYKGNIADPMSLHRFVYVKGNPVSLRDPKGLKGTGSSFDCGGVLGFFDGIAGVSGDSLYTLSGEKEQVGYNYGGVNAGKNQAKEYEIGFSLGCAYGYNWTNATKAKDLTGKSETWTFDFLFFSYTYSKSGKIWNRSFTIGAQLGLGYTHNYIETTLAVP